MSSEVPVSLKKLFSNAKLQHVQKSLTKLLTETCMYDRTRYCMCADKAALATCYVIVISN